MFVLEARGLKKWFGDRMVFSVDHLQIETGGKIGVVGVNGAGKTTLLRVLAGFLEPDEGTVHVRGTVAWIPQEDEIGNGGSTLSGGERTRRKITAALAEKPAMLIADEPTSHLDLESTEWLEKELRRFPGALLLVSHDRELLDAVCDRILEVEAGKVRLYPGNYGDYLRQKEERLQRERFEYERYVSEKKRLTEVMRAKKQKAASMKNPPKGMSPSEARLISNKNKANAAVAKMERQAKALKTRIEKLEKKEKPVELPDVTFDLQAFRPIEGKHALQLEHVGKRFGKKRLLEDFSCSLPTGKKVALLGKNGAGKSTLLRMIAEREDGVHLPPSARIGYFHQHLAVLDETRSILENVKENSPFSEELIRTVLARLLFRREQVHMPVHLLSGGEKVKVALARLFLSEANLLLLDEPTNFLDLRSRQALEQVLKAHPGTIVFASHDRRLIRSLADQLWVLEDGIITVFDGRFDEYAERRAKTGHVGRAEQRERLLALEREWTEVLGRLSVPQKGDDREELERRATELLDEIRKLKQRGNL
ncbi:ribosomal protection-like ABC-F family protein [Staphylospora marina]|uniref:ribosomal protection-like ABC-F family protein n=1 Tax=Staphylospora marina TaxID=2490858 RepID=UPI000F5BA505|nr:ABC-F family ATP-binding cassette domain-containing protein [Staphylospora marina]